VREAPLDFVELFVAGDHLQGGKILFFGLEALNYPDRGSPAGLAAALETNLDILFSVLSFAPASDSPKSTFSNLNIRSRKQKRQARNSTTASPKCV
jgi:hypothetical protein